MTISALVVTLSADPEARATAERHLRADPRVTLGEPIRDRLPLVAETDSDAGGEALLRELEATTGVARVDVVSIDFAGEAR